MFCSAIANQQRPTTFDLEMSARQANISVEGIQELYRAYKEVQAERDRQRQQMQDEAIRERRKAMSGMLATGLFNGFGLFGNPIATPPPPPPKPPEPEVIPIADQIGPRVIQFDE